jgi:hypothetical protein
VQVLFHVRDAARRMPRLEKGVRESVPADLRFSMRTVKVRFRRAVFGGG